MRFVRRICGKCAGMPGQVFYPVNRKLMAAVLAYLAGIVCAAAGFLSPIIAGTLMAFFAVMAVIQLMRRRPVLAWLCALMLVAGNGAAGVQLSLTDKPTSPQTPISGTVDRIESEYRVILKDVSLPDGKTTNRPIMITLMNDDAAEMPEVPLVGQRVSGVGRLFEQQGIRNPGGTDRRIRALCKGYELSGYLLPGWTTEGFSTFSWTESFRRIRLSLSKRLDELFAEHAPLYSAILLGDKGDVDEELALAMRLTGTAHILSVSGMHLSMVSALLYALLRLLPISRKLAYLLQTVGIIGYAGLTGFAVGTIRALVMSMLRILAGIRGRRYDPLIALSVAAFLITAICPLMVFDAGFQFSFFIVLGIHLLAKLAERNRLMHRLRERGEWLYDMLVISASAQLAAAPVQLSLYGFLPVLALPMNLLCAMLLPLLMIVGWSILGVSICLPELGRYLASMAAFPLDALKAVLLGVSAMPGSIVRLPAPGRWVLVLFGAGMALLSPRIQFGRLRYWVCGAIGVVMIAAYLPTMNPAARYVQIDVGQGDASLIRKGRKAVVVDVGPDSSYELLRYLRHEGLGVEAVILTHLDEDHAGALSVLLDSEIVVKRVIMAERAVENVQSKTVVDGLERLEALGIQTEFAKAGDQFDVMGLCIDVLSPTDNESGSNERSMLLRVGVAGKNLLLTGDLPIDSEPALIDECDVLKVAHHGSRKASSRNFLEQASPEIAIISVGKNSYGHPAPRVVKDLNEVGAAVYRTDESGCITIWLKDDLRAEVFLSE